MEVNTYFAKDKELVIEKFKEEQFSSSKYVEKRMRGTSTCATCWDMLAPSRRSCGGRLVLDIV
jgi:hypothetical protein